MRSGSKSHWHPRGDGLSAKITCTWAPVGLGRPAPKKAGEDVVYRYLHGLSKGQYEIIHERLQLVDAGGLQLPHDLSADRATAKDIFLQPHLHHNRKVSTSQQKNDTKLPHEIGR